MAAKKDEKMEEDELKPVPTKEETIMNSKMPEWQKKEYIASLRPKLGSNPSAIPFLVYAKLKKMSLIEAAAKNAYPKAKSVQAATPVEWDEIFKEF